MRTDDYTDDVSSISEMLVPLLVLEELVRTNHALSAHDMSASLGIATTTLNRHLGALAQEGFVETSGVQSTFVLGKRLVALSTHVLS